MKKQTSLFTILAVSFCMHGFATDTLAIDAFVKNLSLEQKIAQLFLVAVDGTSADVSATNYPVPPGGYILFSHNTDAGAEKLISLTGDTQTYYDVLGEIKPFFSIDHEGGLVHRLRDVASPLPSVNAVARFLSPELAYELYTYSARQLKALGIQVNLAPMAEVSYESNSRFTGIRSFGSKEKVIKFGSIFLNAFNDNEVYCVLKHFPGNTNDDPHFSLPVLEGSEEEINSLYVDSFTQLMNDEGLLMSHVVVPSFDEYPSCLSKNIITNLVRNDLAFDGLVFSDDILMDALSKNGYPAEIAIPTALKAGINVLMIAHSEYWQYVEDVAIKASDDDALQKAIDYSVFKILEAKIKMGLYEIKTLDSGIDVLQAKPMSAIVDKEKQLKDFTTAKEKGEYLYYQYWKR